MREVITILGALGVGAAVMYLFDPDRGNQRRALMRDKMVKLNRQTQEAVAGHAKDMSNRAKGLLHDAKAAFEGDRETAAQPNTFS